VTVCRFLLPSGKGLLGNQETAEEAMQDEEFMADMYGRFVAPGQVAYMERHVSSGAETVTALSSMAGTCSLFVVGNGGKAGGDRGVMTSDMGDLDGERPELGPVGELLASDDMVGCGSVLVLQQHKARRPKHKPMRTWNMDSQQQYQPQARHYQEEDVSDSDDAVVDILGSSSSTPTNRSLKPN